MGVPSFFIWLINNFGISNIIKTNIGGDINNLYIDANCAIHPVCFDVLKKHVQENKTDESELELDMIDNVIKYLDFIICNINPKSLVYISVDGVAPLAKIQQQRKRRYKNVFNNFFSEEIKKKHNTHDTIKWNNLVITPGTEFMERMHNEIEKYVINKKNENNHINFIYSSYCVYGEGEHKILQHLKTNVKNNEKCVIYGMDADLIFLSFVSDINNIFLYREVKQLNNLLKESNADFIFVDIDFVKNKYCEHLNRLTNMKFNKTNLINDFTILCFFVGNDFISNIPSICIKNRGIDELINNYMKILKHKKTHLLLSNNIINVPFLSELLFFMSEVEEQNTKNIFFLKNTKKCEEDDDYKKDLWKLENMKYFSTNECVNMMRGNIINIKSKYYEYYCGVNDYYDISVNKIVEKYLEGFFWNILYYFDSCPSWTWYYPYHVSPFASDIVMFLNKNKKFLHSMQFKNSQPLEQFEQLLLVVPKQYSYVLPKIYNNLINESEICNNLLLENLKLDILNKIYFWKCEPFLPFIHLQTIKDFVDGTKKHLSQTDLLRNSRKNDFCL